MFGDEGNAGASAGAGVEARADGVIDCQSTCHMRKR